jgi:membrane-bound lytic murein transglycosylase
VLWICVGFARAWTISAPEGDVGQIPASDVFHEAPAPTGTLPTDPAALAAVARATSSYFAKHGTDDSGTVHPGMLSELGVTLEDVHATLDFVARVAEEDAGKPVQRLQDPLFLAENFRYLLWTPVDTTTRATAPGLRLTKYLVPQVEGRATRRGAFDTALYGVPFDEAFLDEAQAETRKDSLDRFRYTRDAVLDGVYANGIAAGRAPALVWLRRVDALDAMMQGTIEVGLPGGEHQLYNVTRNNGIPYVQGAPPASQDRYWYFRGVDDVLGWGLHASDKIALAPGAAVAGDLWNIGLGKLVALSYAGPAGPEVRLVVLADTGGAFHPNLQQLDWYTGAHASHEAMYDATSAVPDRVQAGILVLRR